jgi:hypothetical protein
MMSLSAPHASIGEADRPAADGQARDELWSLRGKEQRSGGADVGTDDVRSAQTPFIDQAGQERARAVRGDQFRAAIGVAEPRQVDGNHPTNRRDAVPDATEGPQAFGLRANSRTTTSEADLLSANLTRTPSQTRKYVVIGETVSAPI